jgi:hypothetical protein
VSIVAQIIERKNEAAQSVTPVAGCTVA